MSSFVIRRDALEVAGGFTDKAINGEDADLALRLGTARGFVQVLAPETFAYREHDANVMKDLSRSLAGALHMVRQEKVGRYPGGPERARQRKIILTRSLRPVSLTCLKEGSVSDGFRLYAQTFAWNFELGRLRYLAAYPPLALAAALRVRW